MTEYKWKHIEDLPDGFVPPLQDNGMLRRAWKDHQSKLSGSNAVTQFNERLAREWSIETGIIERLYSIDRGTTQILIERGIDESLIPYGATDLPAPEVVRILKTHQDVLQGLFDYVRSDRQLTVSYIKELHQAITRDQEHVEAQDQFGNRVQTKLIRGDWKQFPNNPKQMDGSVHEYCPPEHVQAEMERLVYLHHEHARRRQEPKPQEPWLHHYSPEIQAAWLHHRFAQIHPFQDGNGRVARILASLILIKAGGLPFTVNREDRNKYLDALEAADFGHLLPFSKFITEQQTRGLLKALAIAEETHHEHFGKIIEVAAERLHARQTRAQENTKLVNITKELRSIGHELYLPIVEKINSEIGKRNPDYSADLIHMGNSSDFDDTLVERTVRVLQMQGYAVSNTATHNWFGIEIHDYRRTNIEIGMIGIEPAQQELIAVVAYMTQESSFMDRTHVPDLIPISTIPFVISCSATVEMIRPSFVDWLTSALAVGLAEWEKRIK